MSLVNTAPTPHCEGVASTMGVGITGPVEPIDILMKIEYSLILYGGTAEPHLHARQSTTRAGLSCDQRGHFLFVSFER